MARRRKKRTYAQERLDETLESGIGLAEPACRYAGECGGCAWQAVAYDRQLDFKREWVERAFREQGFDDLKVPTPLGSPDLYRYRNKMEFSFSARRWLTRAEIDSGDPIPRDFALGLHAPGAFDRVLDIASCPIQSEAADRLLEATRAFAVQSGAEPYDIHARTGFLRYLILRVGVHTGQTLVMLVTTERREGFMRDYAAALDSAGLLPTCLANGVTERLGATSEGSEITIDAGSPSIQERIGEWTFELGPETFFQPNTRSAERLCEVLRRFAGLSGRETVLDLYCGVGTFALSLSPDAGEVLGVERVEAAVDSARRNAYANGVNNARFIAHDLDSGLPSALSDLQPDVVIVDPPRAGLHANTVQTIRELAPARVVSVSCHPVPQAENLLALCADSSYYIAETQPVDLFPHTPHVENVALLIRSRG